MGQGGRTLCPANSVRSSVQLDHTCRKGSSGDPTPLASAGHGCGLAAPKGASSSSPSRRANRVRRGRAGIGSESRPQGGGCTRQTRMVARPRILTCCLIDDELAAALCYLQPPGANAATGRKVGCSAEEGKQVSPRRVVYEPTPLTTGFRSGRSLDGCLLLCGSAEAAEGLHPRWAIQYGRPSRGRSRR